MVDNAFFLKATICCFAIKRVISHNQIFSGNIQKAQQTEAELTYSIQHNLKNLALGGA
jgi:hypothetical protein